MRRAARLVLLLLAAAPAAAGCVATSVGPRPELAGPQVPAPGVPAPPVVSDAPLPAADRAGLLGRVAALLEQPGGAAGRAAALQELDRHLASRPRDREDAGLALLGRLLADGVGLDGGLADAQRQAGEERAGAARARERADALAREKAALAADLEKAGRERDELKALVQRLKNLEMQMEEKRKRLKP